jgi:hypothetical protein
LQAASGAPAKAMRRTRRESTILRSPVLLISIARD